MTRVRPSIRRTARILLPILILIAAWQIWDNVEGRRLEAALAKIRPFIQEPKAAGSRTLAGHESAGRFYAAAAVVVQESAASLPEDSVPRLMVRVRDALRRAGEPSPEDVSRSDAALARNDLTLQLVARGGELPFEAFPPGTEFNYRVSGIWSAERMAALATLDALRRHESPAAARLLASRLQLLRAMSAGELGTLWRADALTSQAADLGLLVAQQGVSEPDLRLLDSRLSTVFGNDDLRHFIAAFAKSRYDFVESAGLGRTWQYGLSGVPLRPLLRHRVVTTLATSSDALDIAARPWPERLSGMKGLKDRSSIAGNVFQPYPWWAVAEVVQQATVVMARGMAMSRVARVVLAVDAYRRGAGRLPGSVSELGLALESTIDPFSNQPLRYRVNGDGFVVYSIGDDGRDDGGAIDERLDRGEMPGRGERPDVGLEVTYTRPPR